MPKEKLTYENKMERVTEITQKLDTANIPVGELAKNVKEAKELLKEMDEEINAVEMEVVDAFKETLNEKEK